MNNSHVRAIECEEDSLTGTILPFASRAQHRRQKVTGPSLSGPKAESACVLVDDDDPGPTAA